VTDLCSLADTCCLRRRLARSVILQEIYNLDQHT